MSLVVQRARYLFLPSGRLFAKLGDKMNSIEVVKGKVSPQRYAAVLCGGGNDELDVPGEVLLILLKDFATAAGMIAPRGEEEGGELTVVVANDFANEARGREEAEDLEGGSAVGVEKLGDGEKTASVLDALLTLPTCISSANFSNCRLTTMEPRSISSREENAKAPSLTYNMQKSSKRRPSEKSEDLWGIRSVRGAYP